MEVAAVPAEVAAPALVTPPAAAPVQASSRLLLNGHPVSGEFAPAVVGGRMQGGFRALFAGLGAKVSWLAAIRTARGQSEALTVEVPVGSRIARVNGRRVDMGAAAVVRNGRTVIPVRFFAQATGATLVWDSRTGVAALDRPARAMARQATR